METANHESYVSLEVAKLLKQAGFDWEIYDGYIIYENGDGFTTKFQTSHNFNGDNGDLFINYRGYQEVLSRPTLDVTQRWLREVKNIQIIASPLSGSKKWTPLIAKDFWLLHEDINGIALTPENFDTYELTIESGIKKALELILKKGK